MSNNSLYFLHIPKTAGVSVSSWLRIISGLNTCPAGLWTCLLERDLSEIRKYDLYCGHFGIYLGEYLSKPLDMLTFLRNPVDRAFSHFRHVLRAPNHYFHERVKQHGSFKEFMLDPVTQPLTKNYQVHALSSMIKPWQIWNNQQSDSLWRYWLEQYIEAYDDGLTNSEALSIAKDTLLRCKAFGITERMADSAFLVANALGLNSGEEIGYLNDDQVTLHLSISQDELRISTNLLQLDIELYEFALNTFNERLSQYRTYNKS